MIVRRVLLVTQKKSDTFEDAFVGKFFDSGNVVIGEGGRVVSLQFYHRTGT
jgi:hypothetical protein